MLFIKSKSVSKTRIDLKFSTAKAIKVPRIIIKSILKPSNHSVSSYNMNQIVSTFPTITIHNEVI